MRVEGWESVLFAAVDEARARQFRWSVFDCVTWAFDVRCRLIGIDAAAQWRGKYKSLAGGLRVLRRMGHASVQGLVVAECGPLINPRMAGRGDLAQLQDTALGVVLGHHVATVTEDRGLIMLPAREMCAAWRV